ncbi:hypothetical protein VaNZ11_009324 [Volvox africanus]|uniref:Ig-like domain-containing protein n=1 Tax=Volvox africanus TaxID=51714 RepID=A0ABQ5S971_9CHLO|nr:hypothetical protein VaNZ11_009324 [Volvox africanus]
MTHINFRSVEGEFQALDAQWSRIDCSPQDSCERQAENGRIGKSTRLRSSVSQKVFGPPKLFLLREGVFDADPIINSSRSTAGKLEISDDADEESALPASPQICIRRSKSQNCTLTRHSRGFRIEETGEPDENSTIPFARSFQWKTDKECLPTVSAFMCPSARRMVCESSIQGCAVSRKSPCSDVGVAVTGGIAARPRLQSRKAECPPALPLSREQHRSGRTLRSDHCSSDSDSDMGRGKPIRTGTGEVACRAAPIELGRRRSDHGITHRGRRQSERRRASCWTADDDLANSSSGSGDKDSGDESDGDVDDCAVSLVVPTRSMTGSRRLLRPPSISLVALGSTTPDRSYGSTAAGTPSSPAMMPMFKSAPAPMAATASPSCHTGASANALLFKSFQDVPWPPTASPKSEDASSGRTVLRRATSLRRTALSPQADGEQHGAAGPLPMPVSVCSSCCALDESPRQHGGRGGGGGGGSSSGGGCTPRTSFDMAGDPGAAAAAAAARRVVLRGWSSKGLQVYADNNPRRHVTWLKPNESKGPDPVLLPPQQQQKWQQQQAVCAPTPSSGFKLSERALCLVPSTVAGSEPTGDSHDGSRVTSGNIFGSDDVKVPGVQEDVGDWLSGSFSGHGSGTPRCGGAERGLGAVRLPRLLQPISPSCQQGFTGLPWSLRAKSSSELRVPF